MSATLYAATVTRVDSNGFVYVVARRLSRGEKGPLEPLYNNPLVPSDSRIDTPAGTRVLVGLVEDDPDRLVLLRRF